MHSEHFIRRCLGKFAQRVKRLVAATYNHPPQHLAVWQPLENVVLAVHYEDRSRLKMKIRYRREWAQVTPYDLQMSNSKLHKTAEAVYLRDSTVVVHAGNYVASFELVSI